ncbi:MAG: hypothetical protein K6B67_08175 [Lachnospiraceae bacterium]|nr:hypothetical protein [Lachnospiraceae bacterium]
MQQIVRQYGMIILSMVAVIAVITYILNNVFTAGWSDRYILASNESGIGFEKLSTREVFQKEIIPIHHVTETDVNVTMGKKYNIEDLIIINASNGQWGKILNFSIIPIGTVKGAKIYDREVIFEDMGLYQIRTLVEMDDKVVETMSYAHVN